MAKAKVGILFSRPFVGNFPLAHIGAKLPVYLRFLELCQKRGWEVYVLTRRTYQGDGHFLKSWRFYRGKFEKITKPVRIDLVYDRSAGIAFPPENDETVIWVNRRDFKILAWDKWKAYRQIGKYMPKTFWVGKKDNLAKMLSFIKSDWVVLKPYNGLKGIGIFIGPKSKALKFNFLEKYPKYIAQEFVDTSGGISNVTLSMHDLRVVIVNGKAVWSHVRVPPTGSFKANAAGGGVLTEIDYRLVPDEIKIIVDKIAVNFYKKYDNPLFSIDFGMGKDGVPRIFEINDQIGFPRWEMKQRDAFLEELIDNFAKKLDSSSRFVIK